MMVFLVFLVNLGQSAWSQAPIDLGLTIRSFTQASTPGTWAVLDGIVEEYLVLNKDPVTFNVELALMNAEWQGDEQIVTYRAYIKFAGSGYQEVFPARLPRNPGPEVLMPGTKLLILVRYTGWSRERRAPMFDAVQYRRN